MASCVFGWDYLLSSVCHFKNLCGCLNKIILHMQMKLAMNQPHYYKLLHKTGNKTALS